MSIVGKEIKVFHHPKNRNYKVLDKIDSVPHFIEMNSIQQSFSVTRYLCECIDKGCDEGLIMLIDPYDIDSVK